MLDEVDVKILRVLISDSRASISKIARELRISRPTVRKRIKRLIESKVVKGFSLLIDENLLKGFQVLCLFKASNAEKIVEKLRNLNQISEIYLTTGERNIICIARVADVEALEDLLGRFSSFNTPFEVSIILRTERKPLSPIMLRMVKLTCDYCSKEITGKPLTYTLHNREYYLCCPTCLREFSKKMKLVTFNL